MPNSKLLCTGCKTRFPRDNLMKLGTGNFHSIDCATQHGQELAVKAKQKKEDAKWKVKKQALVTRGKLIRQAQSAFNAFIRWRDHHKRCISCNSSPSDHNLLNGSKFHAGHYRSVGSAPELRFNEDNCFKQCAKCNNYKSGNVVEYRINLVKRIGIERVEAIEGPHDPLKITREELIELAKDYRKKVRTLRNAIIGKEEA